jgi:hypothetical protein
VKIKRQLCIGENNFVFSLTKKEIEIYESFTMVFLFYGQDEEQGKNGPRTKVQDIGVVQ